MTIADIGTWVELYDTRRYLFDIVGPRVRERGYYQFEEFYEVCMWKSARAKPKYLENRASVQRLSKLAIEECDEERKMATLCELRGVSVAMGSALLSVVSPEQYPVIDIRCLEELRKMNYAIGRPSLKNWLTYLKTMRSLAKANKVTPREVDMALFAMNRRAQEYGNLYDK
jgi:thermostable 8-oxoguanine DNA glycosylase